MCYTIVFKKGKVKRLLNIDGFQVTTYWIRFITKDNEKSYTYPRDIIASVVFYP